MEFISQGSPTAELTPAQMSESVDKLLAQLGPVKRVLVIPPDYTRAHSYAGELTAMIYRRLRGKAHVAVMPALGTHSPMTPAQIEKMFPGVPPAAFLVHHWRTDLEKLGEVPGEYISELSDKRLDYSVTCEVNQTLVTGDWDRIVSVGQVVPHEVAGMANHSKNVFVGTGGADTINKTHYLGAVCGMESAMGRVKTPVRDVLNYMSLNLGRKLPIVYLLTVRSPNESGNLVTRGLFAGDTDACFNLASRLSQAVNLDLLDEPLRKAVVFLPPGEFKSTWIGNKAIYRTRMAMADDGELVIMAPGVREFGEDPVIDGLIRKYGYRGTDHTLAMVRQNADLRENLAAAAHLIHGSSEGRFRITWCAGGLSRDEIEAVGFRYANPNEMLQRYPPEKMREGMNEMPGGGDVFFISNPALGLWALKSQFAPRAVTAG